MERTVLQAVSAFLLGGVALSFAFGWTADRMERRRLVEGSFAGLVVLSLLLVPAPQGSRATLLAATFALGGVACAFYTIGLAMLGDRVSAADLAPANSAFLNSSLMAASGPSTSWQVCSATSGRAKPKTALGRT